MTERLEAYTGVAGLMTAREADFVLQEAVRAAPTSTRLVGLGVLMTRATLRGEPKVNHPNRYPQRGIVFDIFSAHPRALNLIHFSADTPPTNDELLELIDVGGEACNGFQFNVSWPSDKALTLVEDRFDKAHGTAPRIVLQVDPSAIVDETALTRMRLAAQLDQKLVTDLLLDGSGGRGKPLDFDLMVRAIETLSRLFEPSLDGPLIGIAGGLNATRVRDIRREIVDYKHWSHGAAHLAGLHSLDAESGVRAVPEDTLDTFAVSEYFEAAAEVFPHG